MPHKYTAHLERNRFQMFNSVTQMPELSHAGSNTLTKMDISAIHCPPAPMWAGSLPTGVHHDLHINAKYVRHPGPITPLPSTPVLAAELPRQ